MTKPTFGSLFAGVGGIDLGFEAAGWEGKFQVEWDPSCQQTLAHHWPDVPRWGDVSDVNGADLPPVDLITFGSPCQDLSTAGKRAGLVEGSRSNLFFQATRIIKEMRDATGNTFPRWALWENVPGAFSSNQGADFGAVLDEMANLGAVAIEWHCLDAQFFGVPQRRRRVFVLACFDLGITKRGRQQVLPVPEGRRGDSATRRKARQDASRASQSSSTGVGRQDAKGWDSDGTGVIGTLAATDYKGIRNQTFDENKVILEFATDESLPFAMGGYGSYSEGVGTLTAEGGTAGGGSETLLVSPVPENSVLESQTVYAEGSYGTFSPGIGATLRASGGTVGAGSENIVVEVTQPLAFQPGVVLRQDQKLSDIVPTLRSESKSGDNEPHVLLLEEEVSVYVKGRRAHTDDDYETWDRREVVPTLNQGDNVSEGRSTVLIIDGTRRDDVRVYEEPVQTLAHRMGTGGNNVPLVAMGAPLPVLMRQREGKAGGGKGPLLTTDLSPSLVGSNELVLFAPADETIYAFDTQFGSNATVMEDVSPTLKATQTSPSVGMPAEMVIPIQDGREIEKHQNGLGVGEEGDPSYTLDQTGGQAVAQQVYAFPSTFSNSTVSTTAYPTLTVGSSIGISSPPAVAYDGSMTLPISHAALRGGGVALTPSPDGNGGESLRDPGFGLGEDGDPMYSLTTTPPAVATTEKEKDMTDTPQPKLVVRRLTPIECERLMGWPDNHTLYRADGKTNSDSTRYKMCGNGVASPVAQWIATHILKAQQKLDEDRGQQ
jgi:DNA (cytosine-5)-methyltransferase 1